MTKERMTLQVLSLAGLVACVIPFLPGDAVKIAVGMEDGGTDLSGADASAGSQLWRSGHRPVHSVPGGAGGGAGAAGRHRVPGRGADFWTSVGLCL